MPSRATTHIQNIAPVDPVALGLCKQSELDAAVQQAVRRRAAEGHVMTDDERRKLVSTETSLAMGEEPRLPSAIAGLENFSLSRDEDRREPELDADSFFNLPDSDEDDDDDN